MKEKLFWRGSRLPLLCQLCSTEFKKHFIDGITRTGYWALMCEDCHTRETDRLGAGWGQKYLKKTLECVEGGYDVDDEGVE